MKFFLQAIYESTHDAAITIDRLTELYDKNVTKIRGMGMAAKSTLQLLAYLEANLIIEITKTVNAISMPYNTVSAAIKQLCDAGIHVQSAVEQRNMFYSMSHIETFSDKGLKDNCCPDIDRIR